MGAYSPPRDLLEPSDRLSDSCQKPLDSFLRASEYALVALWSFLASLLTKTIEDVHQQGFEPPFATDVALVISLYRAGSTSAAKWPETAQHYYSAITRKTTRNIENDGKINEITIH